MLWIKVMKYSIILIFIAHVHNFIFTSMFSYMLTCQLLFNMSFYIILGYKLLICPGDFNMTDGPTYWELLIRNRLVTLTSFLVVSLHVHLYYIHLLCTCIHVNMFMTNSFTYLLCFSERQMKQFEFSFINIVVLG